MFANVESKNGRVNNIDQPRPESYFNLSIKIKHINLLLGML